MKAQIKAYLAALTLIGSAQLLVACDKTGAVTNAPHVSSTTAQGTSDSGGGTGVDGKVFESYIVDPTELAAFKEQLAPRFANLVDDKGQASHYEILMKMKTWYVAPVELEKIGKATLGVSFMNNDTQQIARQTSNEVWISKPLFEAMDKRAQSELLMHEFVMELYFLKFQRVSDLCKPVAGVQNSTASCPTGAVLEAIEKSMPPEKAHPLNEQDNANIRAVTGWLLQNSNRAIPQSEFYSVLANKDFDKRIFRALQAAKDLKDIKITRDHLLSAIKASDLLGTPMSKCAGITTGESVPCKFDVSMTTENFAGTNVPALHVRVSLPGKRTIEFDSMVSDDVNMFLDEDLDGSLTYSVALANIPEKVQVGDRLATGFLNFRKANGTSQSPLVLNSIVIQQTVVTSIDRARDPICEASTPHADHIEQDGLLITHAGSKLSLEETMQLSGPGFAACTAQNVP